MRCEGGLALLSPSISSIRAGRIGFYHRLAERLERLRAETAAPTPPPSASGLIDAQYAATELRWGELDRERFGAAAALVFAYLNHAHPFRDGNGRATRVFMQHVAERSRFNLDFTRVDPGFTWVMFRVSCLWWS